MTLGGFIFVYSLLKCIESVKIVTDFRSSMDQTRPRQPTPESARFSITSVASLVLMITVLFVAMVVAGITLNHQINVLETLPQTFSGAQDFQQSNRLLLLILGLSTFGMVVLLTVLLINLRRFTAERNQTVEGLVQFNTALENRLKQRDSDLADERAQLKTVLNNMQEGVVLAENARIRYTNRAFARISGFSMDEMSGRSLETNGGSVLPLERDLSQLHHTVSGAIEMGGIWQGLFTLHPREGESLDVAVVGTPVNGMNGHSRQIMALIRDASQEKKLHEQKTNFVSNASHELRTPLSNMKMRLYLLRKQPEKLEEHLQVMENVTVYMQQLIDDMMDVGRFERGVIVLERENAKLQDLVEQGMKSHRARADRRTVELTCDMPTDSITVSVDQKRVVQVINNLVSNAMNHTPQDGKVNVRVQLEALTSLTASQRFASVRVQDNGTGIPADMLAQIFQPFASASQGLVSGTVLGLSLAKEIIELHGGEIMVESEEGKGATYTFTIPVAGSPAG